MKQLRVHGAREAEPARTASPLQRAVPALTVKHSVRVELARDGTPPQTLDGIDDDDIVEIELDGGLRLWSRGDDLERELGVARSRDASSPDTLELGPRLRLGGPTAASRGTGDWIIRGLKILGVDLAGTVTDVITQHVEAQLKPGPGLYRCAPDRQGELTEPASLSRDQAVLLFIHGTASSIDGCYSELWKANRRWGQALTARYGERILAFQHRTLSESPIQNACDLLRALKARVPAGTTLHLVTHSRGGLIGDLLARGNRTAGAPIDATDLRLFKSPGRAADAAALEELGALLQSQRYRIERFVRIASPTRGTTLADGRLDKYLSVVLNVLQAIPGLQESLVFDTFASLLTAVLKKRLSPADLPGLEAMVPGSPTVRLVNRPDVRTEAGLAILGGDVEGSGFWGRLKTFATDVYYREDHDLVVNTPAMFGGAERTTPVRYWIDAGGQVNHFNYFVNDDTASRLLSMLESDSASGLHVLEQPLAAVTADDYRKRAGMAQPVVVVVPGSMGSQLSVNGKAVWLEPVEIAKGRLEQLEPGSAEVTADALLGFPYAALIKYLSASHDVVPFPYDWRLSLTEAAEGLRRTLDATLDRLGRSGQPIRILAHSTGGLVVRAMLATPAGRSTWDRACGHLGARVILLGMPGSGSYAAVNVLLGRDDLIARLGLLDVKHGPGDLVATLARCRGVLELLPPGGDLDLHDPAVWDRLRTIDTTPVSANAGPRTTAGAPGWTPPEADDLAAARAFWTGLHASPLDPARMIYVAGAAEETPCGLRVDESGDRPHIEILATGRGDGRVAWATGIPRELSGSTYYMDARHGDLANDQDVFPAIVDLLEHGRTSKLPQTPPVSRGADTPLPMRPSRVDTFPDAAALASDALGGRRGRKRRRLQPPVHVRVVHNNLIWARFPVVVGHYSNDVIVGAEALLDRQLDGRLRDMHRLDLYPGAYNRAAVVLNDRRGRGAVQHPGAIVAGLGAVGELTPGALAATLTHALLTYGAEAIARERERRRNGTSVDTGTEIPLGITPLLVGAGAGGVKLADSIQAILRAVQAANARLAPSVVAAADTGARLRARIVSVDLLELFEDRAIQIVRELRAFAGSAEFRTDFLMQEILASEPYGERRATFDELPGWWRRIRITSQGGDVLRFETLTDRAGAPVDLQPTQRPMVQSLLTRAIRGTATDLELSSTLFELLVPRSLKEQAPDRRPLVMVVDETSAMLPWELMHDQWTPGARPLSVDSGMIRQLVAPARRRSQRASDDSALVIGDPPLEGAVDFVQLPGAAAEASAVAEALRKWGFDTRALIGDEAHWSTVLGALLARSYRVLHIAAHGVFEYATDGRSVTGIVLGNGAFLTPAELEQMRVVPDLVFINCCHLGAQGEYGRPVDVAFPHLAANIAQQLIDMGVRAVVAAGWAVDDQAAKAFAECFYSEMLTGREFGRAVQTARQEIFSRFNAVNTWGAYQCYGDPGFSLRPPVGGGDASLPVAERELEYLIRQIGNRIRGGRDTREDLLARLDRAIDTAQQAWLTSGSMCAEIARAYAELGQIDRALPYFERVLIAEPASASLTAVEQFANALARAAARQDTRDRAGMRRAIDLLEHLCAIGRTSERLSLLGGTYKRRALKESGAARVADLERMTQAYEESYNLAVAHGRSNAWYPLANAIAGKLTLQWLAPSRARKDTTVTAALGVLRGLADKLAGSSTDLWELALSADVELLEAVARGRFTLGERRAVAQAYRDSATRAGSPREVSSTTGQIAFLRDMARSSRRAPVRTLASALDALLEDLASNS